MQEINPPPNLPIPSTREWTTNLVRMLSFVDLIKPTKLQNFLSTSPSKIIYVVYIFQDINKQMLKISYTLNLKQLIKIVPNQKKYMWQKLKVDKPQINIRTIILKATTSIILDINTITIIINNHMAIVQVQIGINTIDDAFLNGGSKVNIIIGQLRAKLRLFKIIPTPYNLQMVDQTTTKPMGLIKDLRMYVHGIPYIVTFIVLQNIFLNSNYSMLLGRPWFRNVTHDWGIT